MSAQRQSQGRHHRLAVRGRHPLRLVPDHARGGRGGRGRLADARQRRGARAALRHRALVHRLPRLLAEPDIEMVTIAAPNRLHCADDASTPRDAGKHVVCEKPLCMTLEEADEMIDACRRQGVLLMYAEELFFTPKYVQAKRMADEGAFGKVHLVKQSEKHSGPHGDWFWDVEQSGGGVFMDMGCHGIAFCYWFLDRPAHQERLLPDGHLCPRRQDHGAKTTASCILEFEGGAVGLVENSWARPGGMDDRVEVYGDGGLTYANLHMGNALPTYSETGYGYAVEKAPSTKGLDVSRSTKSSGTTASPRRCATSPGACAARRRRSPPARTGGSCRRRCSRPISRRGRPARRPGRVRSARDGEADRPLVRPAPVVTGAIVRTVDGDIAPAELGPCDAHEHLFLTTPIQPGEDFLDVDRNVAEARTVADAGARAIVDWTPIGLGRDPAGLCAVAARAGLHVVAATGSTATPTTGPTIRCAPSRPTARRPLHRRGDRRYGRRRGPRRPDQVRRELSPRDRLRGPACWRRRPRPTAAPAPRSASTRSTARTGPAGRAAHRARRRAGVDHPRPRRSQPGSRRTCRDRRVGRVAPARRAGTHEVLARLGAARASSPTWPRSGSSAGCSSGATAGARRCSAPTPAARAWTTCSPGSGRGSRASSATSSRTRSSSRTRPARSRSSPHDRLPGPARRASACSR